EGYHCCSTLRQRARLDPVLGRAIARLALHQLSMTERDDMTDRNVQGSTLISGDSITPRESRIPDIRDQAGGLREARWGPKLGAGRKSLGYKPKRSREDCQGLATPLVIVDDRNQRVHGPPCCTHGRQNGLTRRTTTIPPWFYLQIPGPS